MINSQDLNEVKRLIKTQKRPIIIRSQSPEFNRKILEYGKFDILLSIESTAKKESLRSLDSGFNEILGRIASKNKVALGIDLEEISRKDKKALAKTLEKINQNIRISRKTKTKIKLLNYKDKISATSFLISLGASTEQSKEALSF